MNWQKFELKEVEAKSVLTTSRLPGVDFVINPYIGCRFACKYCYASFMGRFVGKSIADWGNYVYVKLNAAELLGKELPRKLPKKGEGKEILLSSVTDPYQGVEAKYRLTRRCLQSLLDFNFEGTLAILTKSNLVLRDIELFKQFNKLVVGLTVTSSSDSVSRYFEKYAPPVSERLKALRELNKNNIKTYAFIGPLLPHFVAKRESLENLFQALSDSGTKDVFIEHLNLSPYIRKRLIAEMQDAEPKILERFYISQSQQYRQELEEIVDSLIKKYEMNLLLDSVLLHRDYMGRKPD